MKLAATHTCKSACDDLLTDSVLGLLLLSALLCTVLGLRQAIREAEAKNAAAEAAAAAKADVSVAAAAADGNGNGSGSAAAAAEVTEAVRKGDSS